MMGTFSAMRFMFAMAVVLATFTGACTDDTDRAATPSPPLTAPAVPADLDDGCDRAPYLEEPPFPSVHTIPLRAEPVAYEISVAPPRVCPGGRLRVVVRVTNKSDEEVRVAPQLVVRVVAGRDKLDCCGFVTLGPGRSRTIVSTVVVPPWTPLGSNSVSFRNYGAGDRGSGTFDVVAA